ncbi:MAG: AAA family ATPase [Anaerolineae bacterium]|nr:AAA family ATPase [Anaerolineae bacterium]
MNPDYKFRHLKALEIERALEQHYGDLESVGTQFYQLEDGHKLVFIYATGSGSGWYTPTVERLHEQLQAEDLVGLAYTDEASAHLWVFAVPVGVLLDRMQEVGVKPTLSNETKYSLDLEHANGFKLRQLDMSLADYQIISQPTDLTRSAVGLAEPPADLVSQAGSLHMEQLQRLLRWKLDGSEEQGEEYNFADVRRRLNVIRPELQLLADEPEAFTEASLQTVLDHMHAAHRQKGNILRNNDIENVRQELKRFLFDEDTDLTTRFDRCQISNIGPSIKGELISWYNPDLYPLDNGAARAGLRYFGFEPGAEYASFRSAFQAFREIYERVIGHLHEDLPLNLEIDQLFNQIHKVDLKETANEQDEESKDEEPTKVAYWRVTLPAQGDQNTVWSVCLEKGIAAIGFKDKGDDYWQVRNFAQIKSGDWVVAFLREKRIGAIGQVTEPYDPSSDQAILPDEDYWQGSLRRRIRVKWYPRELAVDQLSPSTRNRFRQKTVLDLSPAEFGEIREHYADLLPEGEDEIQPSVGYTVSDFVRRAYQPDDQWYNEVVDLVHSKGQIILYGPPGTGKTFLARELGKAITGLNNPGLERCRLVQFHPSYSYEEFIEGIRPESRTVEGRHVVDYPVRDGVFKRFCIDAAGQQDACVFVIDEINRGNIASIFGELMYALEYRDQATPAVLPYSGDSFVIPDNVYIIGTMNTADRSISLMDFALRRRFHFVRCTADPQILQRWAESRHVNIPYLLPLFRLLLEAIEEQDYQIGMSYFMDDALTEERLRRIWKRSIEPYLETYFIDDPGRVDSLRWQSARLRELRHKHSEDVNA